MPIIHLNISMDRSEAVQKAHAVAKQYALGPENPSHATAFNTDETVKTFIELKGGGKDVLFNIMEHHLYEPYTWQVRLFRPYEAHEARILFRPDGVLYGFQETLPESYINENITSKDALNIAETFMLQEPWKINLAEYNQIESSHKTNPSGRIDHTFVYERHIKNIGDGEYRLSIVIAGNHPSELLHFIKIPETFTQEYAHMRSQNSNFAYIASLLMFLLYGIGCCGIGCMLLINRNALQWKPAVSWAIFISFWLLVVRFNRLPFDWMRYNTSLSPSTFIMSLIISGILFFIGMSLIFSITFMCAEGLTRLAFPERIQLWSLCNQKVAGSYTILKKVLIGFLLMPYFLAYVILFYFFTNTYLGWWSPASALFDPNILATYVPWLESVVLSLQAGFWEECLFRALPLASALLLGQKYGKKQWWIAAAFMLQMFIFGAAHADYPAQPAYARIVELIIFSAAMGIVYLQHGLLPCILAHFSYDVCLFALPILVTSSSYALFNKLCILMISLIPVWIIFYARINNGKWVSISSDFFNKSWKALPQKQTPESLVTTTNSNHHVLHKTGNIILIIACFAFAGWIHYSRFTVDNPPINATRSSVTKNMLNSYPQIRNIDRKKLLVSFLPHYSTMPEAVYQHRYIWQHAQNQYHSLMNNYLIPPLWITRLAQFEGPLQDRAEEIQTYYKPDGTIFRTLHKIAETHSGPKLTEQEALPIAYNAVEQSYNLTHTQLKKISAQSQKQPDRIDWNIEFQDLSHHIKDAQARISITISGDHVTDMYRYVHVPEEWKKQEENSMMVSNNIYLICYAILYIMIAALTFQLLYKAGLTTVHFSLLLFAFSTIISIGELINAYPTIVMWFNTSQPFSDQLFRSCGLTIFIHVLYALFITFAVGFANNSLTTRKAHTTIRTIATAIGVGIIGSCIESYALHNIPPLEPTWANLVSLTYTSPCFAIIVSALKLFTLITVGAVTCFRSLNCMPFMKNKMYGALIALCIGFGLSGITYAHNTTLWILIGCAYSIFLWIAYYALFRWNVSIVPFASGSYIILKHMQRFAIDAYPHAAIYHGSTIILIIVCMIIWFKNLEK